MLTTRIESNTGTVVSTGLTKSLERLIVLDEGADKLVRELGIIDTTQTASNSILHILSKRREYTVAISALQNFCQSIVPLGLTYFSIAAMRCFSHESTCWLAVAPS